MITQVCDLGDINYHQALCEQDLEHAVQRGEPTHMADGGNLAFCKHHSVSIPAKPKVKSSDHRTYDHTIVYWVPIW